MPSLLSLPGGLSWGNRSSSVSRPSSRQSSPAPSRSSFGVGRRDGRTGSAMVAGGNIESSSANFCRVPSAPPGVVESRGHDIPPLPAPLVAPGNRSRSAMHRTGTAEVIDELGHFRAHQANERHHSRLDAALAATQRLGRARARPQRQSSRLGNGITAIDQMEALRSRDAPKAHPPDWADFRRQWSTSGHHNADVEGNPGDMSRRTSHEVNDALNDTSKGFKRLVTY
mmetsp:Transcript_97142/g.187232  ORF Transcript_97142/g.187232 Transcript_97142/m.187232 type:complete len:227 (+) Transcript_97142:81-761(+)